MTDKPKNILPVLPLRGVLVFPYMMANLDVGRTHSMKSLERAALENNRIILATQKSFLDENPIKSGIYTTGVLAEIKQFVKMPNNTMRVLVEGLNRVKLGEIFELDACYFTDYQEFEPSIRDGLEVEALRKLTLEYFEKWGSVNNKVSPEVFITAKAIEEPQRFFDFIVGNLFIDIKQKQELLEEECLDIAFNKVLVILTREIDLLEIAKKISQQVKKQVDKNQKEYYLKEQLKAINKELSAGDESFSEVREEYKKKMRKLVFPKEVLERINKELARLEKMPAVNMEGAVIRNYLDTLINVPWDNESIDLLDIEISERTLAEDHYGLEKVKERIIEFLAVKILTKSLKGPILCLAGPPGVGKTSLAKSIAKAMNRKFVRMSLGGVRDEAEIRGHRRTYIGAMPGRIVQGLINCKTKNPVFLLDEIDKMSSDFRGDPTAAMLEVLDAEQNNTFQDHYVDLPLDLSKVFWIVTANDIGNIPRPLLDRMEVINLSSYTQEEKVAIAEKYLLPRKIEEHGLTTQQLILKGSVLERIIRDYTREAGVRSLERSIAKICRKVAREVALNSEAKCIITVSNLKKYLSKPLYNNKDRIKVSQPGLVNGLAWTNFGGEVLNVEVLATAGKGELLLTGQLGDVMVESAKAAYSYLKANSKKLNLNKDFPSKIDIHVHFPAGATPKDGPSAGITMAVALISALKNQAVDQEIAMTGEITLLGRVLAVGGVKEKVLAAYRYGIVKVFLPKANIDDLDEIPGKIKKQIKFIAVENVFEVISEIFGGES